MENYRKNVRNIAILLGYLNIVINLEKYKDVKEDYINILKEISKQTSYYIENHNFNNLTSSQVKELWYKIDMLREKKLFDKNIGDEGLFSDEVLIWYEIVFLKK